MPDNDVKDVRGIAARAQECLEEGEFEKALTHFGEILDLLPDSDSETRAGVLNNIGLANARLGRYREALSSFETAADIFRQLGHDIALGQQLGNIGSVYRDLEDFDSAMSSYLESLAVFERAGNDSGIAAQYSNLSYAHSRKGELGEALGYSIKALKLFDELGDAHRAGLCRQNIAALKAHLEGGEQR